MILISACLAGIRSKYNDSSNEWPEAVALIREGKALPLCPEQLGGLPTPRPPAEIVGGTAEDVLDGKARVVDIAGRDVTEAFLIGAREVLRIARLTGAKTAILKERSPSCGSSLVYDGSHQGRTIAGQGVTAALLRRHGVAVWSGRNLAAPRLIGLGPLKPVCPAVNRPGVL